MLDIKIEIVSPLTQPNSDFLIEYENIRKEFNRQPLTDRTKYNLIARWRGFVYGLVERGLMDEEVGISLFKFLEATITVK